MTSLGQISLKQQTQVFLGMLEPKAKNKIFHFRTFDDDKERKDKGLVRTFSKTLGEAERELTSLNGKGAGAFVVINDGGQTSEKITRIRAVFADTDGAPLEPLISALEPHMVVCSSPEKWHVYWLVDSQFELGQFKPIQKAIARKYGTDQAVNDLPRVMRLPGFYHRKALPFMVHIESVNVPLPRYSAEQIIEGLGLEPEFEEPPPSQVDAFGNNLARTGRSYSLAEMEEVLRYVDPWGHRDRWRNVLFALVEEYGADASDLWVRWSRGELWAGGRS